MGSFFARPLTQVLRFRWAIVFVMLSPFLFLHRHFDVSVDLNTKVFLVALRSSLATDDEAYYYATFNMVDPNQMRS
jgi:hypothetical protein